MAIQYGVNTWVWTSPLTTASARELILKVKAMGFDLFEIPLEAPSLLDAATVRQMLADHGLMASVCGAFGPARDLSSDDAAIVNNALAYIRQCLVFCRDVGARVFAGPMYSAVGKARLLPPDERRAEFDRSVAGLKQAAAMAADYGVTLGIEPLNRFETDMINTAAQAVAMCDAIDHPAAQVMLDGFHMNIEETNVAEAIQLAGARLCHVQVSDSHRGAPGAGLMRWEQFKAGLDAINYSGAVVIESFTPGVIEIARAAAIWRPLAASQDELAQDGLKFLRGLL
ncbi:MAG: sugar phosphate isomerase/epimerase family protein [Blastocatellales bacterium]